MTATGEGARRTAPRPLIRIVWALHRAAYRFSRGGLGLSRLVTGSKFGMLGLTSVGRRTGQARVAIIGYFEDGPNLVTLRTSNTCRARQASACIASELESILAPIETARVPSE